MAFDQDALQWIDAALASASDERDAFAWLRSAVAKGVSVMRCDALDMRDETPFRSYAGCDLFLVDGADHCWKITADPRRATGFVLAPSAAPKLDASGGGL
jgi:hypothetical protein